MAQLPDVSIVIPCYNEAPRIGPSLTRLRAFLQTRPESYEVLVVNDGSKDQTVEVVRSMLPQLPGFELLDATQNEGKEPWCGAASLAARGARVLFTDADLATPPGRDSAPLGLAADPSNRHRHPHPPGWHRHAGRVAATPPSTARARLLSG